MFDDVDVGATAAQTSPSVDITSSNGFFSIAALASSAATAKVEVYYQESTDNTNWTAATLSSASVGETYTLDGFDPPVGKYVRLYAIGTSDNAPSTTLKAWLNFTED